LSYHARVSSPFGWIGYVWSEAGVERVVLDDCFVGRGRHFFELDVLFESYFEGKVVDFRSIALASSGTVFEERVWSVVRGIPYGEVCSYSQVAAECGSLRACRAVGSALNRNPTPILVPCHRVVGKNGLGGFKAGMRWKKRLLELEGVDLSGFY
jgi:methylated-DNA-[protein]-cysteine S-methyltransferase